MGLPTPGTPEAKFPIISEEIEPTAAMLIGRMFARCEAVPKDSIEFEHHCQSLWWVIIGLFKISIGVSTALHFSLACNAHRGMVRDYIMKHIGCDPEVVWEKWN